MFHVNQFKTGALKICDIDPEVREKGRLLRFRKNQKSTTAAIIRKCKWTGEIHIVQEPLDFSVTQYV